MALVPPAVVTVMSTVPAGLGGEVAVTVPSAFDPNGRWRQCGMDRKTLDGPRTLTRRHYVPCAHEFRCYGNNKEKFGRQLVSWVHDHFDPVSASGSKARPPLSE